MSVLHIPILHHIPNISIFLGGLFTLIDHYFTTERPPTWRRTGGFIAPKTACGTRTNGGFNMQLIYKIMKVSWNRGTPKSSRRVGNWTWRRCLFDVCGFCVVFRFSMDMFFFCLSRVRLISIGFYDFSVRRPLTFWHFMPRKLLYFWGVISQSDSGAIVLAQLVWAGDISLVTSAPRSCQKEIWGNLRAWERLE